MCYNLSDVEKDSTVGMEQTVEQVKKLIGEPRNYGPTPEEKAEIDRRTLDERVSLINWPVFYLVRSPSP